MPRKRLASNASIPVRPGQSGQTRPLVNVTRARDKKSGGNSGPNSLLRGGGPKIFLEDDVCEVVLPRYMIRQKCLWGGWRQPEKPVIPIPVYKPRANILDATKMTDMLVLPGFHHWEYRFWCAVPSDDNKMAISECRACSSVFSGDAARKAHIGDKGCAKKLTDAYVLLLKDMICVICNMKSYKTKWGVPLCSPACATAWCSVEPQPQALTLALALAETEK